MVNRATLLVLGGATLGFPGYGAAAVARETAGAPDAAGMSGHGPARQGAASENARPDMAGQLSQASLAGERLVHCLIDNGAERYDGPCLFRSGEGNSFFVRRADGCLRFGDGTDVSVVLTGRGQAEDRGLTRSGINARMGAVLCSDADRACRLPEDGTLSATMAEAAGEGRACAAF
ncbi:hypothetical protein GCM10011316_39090 [Roseibium aquae]|uniref:Uncharacterized protein n=1 Tax=Roseibium aquae TaxID=1323746 RepID=A0A916TR07_9HYPH|nr:hypothetical protein [Roseibium aquae]GGB63417.1 hypothetical protein GCM10011316_39090 [Roseibium aquae]